MGLWPATPYLAVAHARDHVLDRTPRSGDGPPSRGGHAGGRPRQMIPRGRVHADPRFDALAVSMTSLGLAGAAWRRRTPPTND
jgi:hypothetical protein